MKYLQMKELYPSRHNLTYTDSTRSWLLNSDAGSVVSNRVSWALIRFLKQLDYEPELIPIIEIENIKDEVFDYNYAMPEGYLLDFFSIGVNFFVSSRLKDVLESFKVEALFAEASININGSVYCEPCFLLSPRDILDVFDKNKSVYSLRENAGGEVRIKNVDKFVLVDSEVDYKQKMFFLYMEGVSKPLMIRSDIAKKIAELDLKGIGFLSVENMKKP